MFECDGFYAEMTQCCRAFLFAGWPGIFLLPKSATKLALCVKRCTKKVFGVFEIDVRILLRLCVVVLFTADEDGIHILDDGNFFYEVEGLPEVDPDEDVFPTAKKPSKVKFSTSPMKVSVPTVCHCLH